jgi:hypothetical protein
LVGRFQRTVSNSLSIAQPEVVELHLELTPKMQVHNSAFFFLCLMFLDFGSVVFRGLEIEEYRCFLAIFQF